MAGPPTPFFVSVHSKSFSVLVSRLESALADEFVSVDSM